VHGSAGVIDDVPPLDPAQAPYAAAAPVRPLRMEEAGLSGVFFREPRALIAIKAPAATGLA